MDPESRVRQGTGPVPKHIESGSKRDSRRDAVNSRTARRALVCSSSAAPHALGATGAPGIQHKGCRVCYGKLVKMEQGDGGAEIGVPRR